MDPQFAKMVAAGEEYPDIKRKHTDGGTVKMTKFIAAASASDLTKEVQEAEREGWTYVGMHVAMAFRPDPKVFPNLPETLFVAAMQREPTPEEGRG